jgi:molecular chaperone DnaK
MTKMIPRNTTIPASKVETFTTAADNQTAVTIVVLQGERQMSADNKEITRFDLVGIPPAPRGMPQIEVTFDIDANGILSVKAKDKATQKEQSIKITPSSGLTSGDIDKMVKDAELYAEEDRQKKELAEIKNQADQLIYASEKTLSENGDKIADAEKDNLTREIGNLKTALDSGNKDTVKAGIEALSKAAQKVAEALAAHQQSAESAPQNADAGSGAKAEGEVLDADFEEVDKK